MLNRWNRHVNAQLHPPHITQNGISCHAALAIPELHFRGLQLTRTCPGAGGSGPANAFANNPVRWWFHLVIYFS